MVALTFYASLVVCMQRPTDTPTLPPTQVRVCASRSPFVAPLMPRPYCMLTDTHGYANYRAYWLADAGPDDGELVEGEHVPATAAVLGHCPLDVSPLSS